MQYRQLGASGLFVSELCLGTMTFGGKGLWANMGSLDAAEAQELIARALEAGINFIDTADVYSFGASEEMVGQALRALAVPRDEVVIATKVCAQMGRGPNSLGTGRGHILDGVRASLRRLGLDHIDLYQLHNQDDATGLEETVQTMDMLVRQGLIRYWGVSNWNAWQVAKAIGICERDRLVKPVTVQAYYSAAGRDLEREILPMAQDAGLGLLPWSPLAGGLLSGKFGRGRQAEEGSRRSHFDFPPVAMEHAYDVIEALEAVAGPRGATVAQVALAWLLGRPQVASVIVGARRVAQLDDNIGATGLTLDPAELALLDKATALRPEYPAWIVRSRRAIAEAAGQAG